MRLRHALRLGEDGCLDAYAFGVGVGMGGEGRLDCWTCWTCRTYLAGVWRVCGASARRG